MSISQKSTSIQHIRYTYVYSTIAAHVIINRPTDGPTLNIILKSTHMSHMNNEQIKTTRILVINR